MKLLIYEIKKILNVKLLIALGLFTLLFYSMFMRLWIHPHESADCVAQNDLAAVLRDENDHCTVLGSYNFCWCTFGCSTWSNCRHSTAFHK